MALTIDGSGAKATTSGTVSSLAATISTSNTNDIIIAFVHLEKPSGGAQTVSGVSGGGLTWALRKRFTWTVSAISDDIEIWWAASTSTLTSQTITASFTGNIDDASLQLIAVSGVGNLTSPWDSNASLPATATPSTANPTVTVSTTSASTLMLGFWGIAAPNSATPGTGFTALYATTGAVGTLWSYTNSEYETFSSAQSSISVGWTIGAGSVSGGGMVFDALVANAQHLQTATISTTSSVATTGANMISKTASWTTTSALAAIKSAGKLLSWGTSSAVSVIAGIVRSKIVSIASNSTLSMLKSAAKIIAIASSSALSLVTSHIRPAVVTISNSSALSMVRSIGKLMPISTTGALSVVLPLVTQIINISTHGALSVGKAITHTLGWITKSKLVAKGVRVRYRIVSFVTHGAPQLSRQPGKVVAVATSGALSVIKAAGKLAILATTSSVVTIIINGVGNPQLLSWTTTSSLGVLKMAGKEISFATVSGARLSRMVSKTISFYTISALQGLKSVAKSLAWTTISALSAIAKKAKLSTVTIASSSAVSISKALTRANVVTILSYSVVSIRTIFKAGRASGITLIGRAYAAVVTGLAGFKLRDE